MEKTIWWKKFEFKEIVNMLDRQKCSNALRNYYQTQDEFELCFNLFPIFCTKIDDQTMNDDAKKKYLQEMTDLDLFKEIQEMLTSIIESITDQKKKTNSNINSIDTLQPEK